MEKLSFSYRVLRKVGLNFPEETYGNVSFFKVFARASKRIKDAFLLRFFMKSAILSPISPRILRPAILRNIGCRVGKDVFIGEDIFVDSGNAKLITIEDGVHVAARSMLMCHKRNLTEYHVGYEYGKMEYMTGKIHLKKGCAIGTNTLIMPNVTVGEGAIVGAYSLVTKDVPPWTISIGRPAKVIRSLSEGEKHVKDTKK